MCILFLHDDLRGDLISLAHGEQIGITGTLVSQLTLTNFTFTACEYVMLKQNVV